MKISAITPLLKNAFTDKGQTSWFAIKYKNSFVANEDGAPFLFQRAQHATKDAKDISKIHGITLKVVSVTLPEKIWQNITCSCVSENPRCCMLAK